MDTTTSSSAPGTAVLRAAYPNANFPPETVDLYERCLSDLDEQHVIAAIRALVLTSKWLPTVAEIRGRVAEKMLELPSTPEAWAAVDASDHPAVLQAKRRTGDQWRWRTGEEWVLRRDFEKSYADVRAEMLAEAMLGERPMQPVLPPAQPRIPLSELPYKTEAEWTAYTVAEDRRNA